MTETTRSALIFGARNLGRAIIETLVAQGWNVAGAARSDETLASVTAAGALALRSDITDQAAVRATVEEATEALGALDLIVNAVSAARPPSAGPFGGGPFADATLDGFRGWTAAVAEQAFVFLSEGARAGAGTLIQVTGGSARRAIAGRGLWAAGAAATRALTHSAALELREQGIHVALLIVDATIESPKTAGFIPKDAPANATADMGEIAKAVEYLASQSGRALTHELVVTPAGDRWLP